MPLLAFRKVSRCAAALSVIGRNKEHNPSILDVEQRAGNFTFSVDRCAGQQTPSDQSEIKYREWIHRCITVNGATKNKQILGVEIAGKVEGGAYVGLCFGRINGLTSGGDAATNRHAHNSANERRLMRKLV